MRGSIPTSDFASAFASMTSSSSRRRHSREVTPSIRRGWRRRPPRSSGSISTHTDEAAKRKLLTETFHFHELAVEDALAESHHPKIETVRSRPLPDPARHRRGQEAPGLRDAGRRFLSRAELPRHRALASTRGRSTEEREVVRAARRAAGRRAVRLLHRIIDRMVDHYRPEVDGLEDRLEVLEQAVFGGRPGESAAGHSRAEIGHRVAPPGDAAAARRRSAGWRGASFPQISERCRTGSATSTITWCGSPTRPSSCRTV